MFWKIFPAVLMHKKQHKLSITAHKISVHAMLKEKKTHLSQGQKVQREIGQAVQSGHYTVTSTTRSTDDCKYITPSSLRSPW